MAGGGARARASLRGRGAVVWRLRGVRKEGEEEKEQAGSRVTVISAVAMVTRRTPATSTLFTYSSLARATRAAALQKGVS